MLVLSRKAGESIEIGDNVRIVVIRMRGSDRVTLGIVAPDQRIVRTELLAAINPSPSPANDDSDQRIVRTELLAARNPSPSPANDDSEGGDNE